MNPIQRPKRAARRNLSMITVILTNLTATCLYAQQDCSDIEYYPPTGHGGQGLYGCCDLWMVDPQQAILVAQFHCKSPGNSCVLYQEGNMATVTNGM